MFILLLQTEGPVGVRMSEAPSVALAQAPGDCPPDTGPNSRDDIVVCARPDNSDAFRLNPLDQRFETAPDRRARGGRGKGAVGEVDVEQADILGAPSNRVMLRFKLPF